MYSKKYILLFMISYIKVVICSKFPTFVVESTTRQLSAEELAGCDLLEISYLCGRINNRPIVYTIGQLVVICSKFPTFVVESTTETDSSPNEVKL